MIIRKTLDILHVIRVALALTTIMLELCSGERLELSTELRSAFRLFMTPILTKEGMVDSTPTTTDTIEVEND